MEIHTCGDFCLACNEPFELDQERLPCPTYEQFFLHERCHELWLEVLQEQQQ